MPAPPRDAPPSPDSSRPSGLAGVFKGLTSGRLSKSPPPLLPQLYSPSGSSLAIPPSLDTGNAGPTALRGFTASHMAAFKLLRNGSPSERIAAATTLRQAIAEYPLNPTLDIWYAAKDMIEPGKSSATRIAGWELLTACVKQSTSTDLERKEYFQTLTATTNHEDFHLQLASLVELTRNGRDLSGFDYEVLPLLRNWLDNEYKEVSQARRRASRVSKAVGQSRASSAGEERNLSQLFVFIYDVLKFNFNVADVQSICYLIDSLSDICMNTTVQDDLRSCISVLKAFVTFGSIPAERLKRCVQVLSSIYCLVPNLEKEAWNTVSMLCKSHNGQLTVRILLDILRNSPGEGTKEMDVNRELRGALCVIRKLLSKSTEKGYPTVPFVLLADGLATTVKTTSSIKAYSEVLKLVNLLFDRGDGTLHQIAVDEDWTILLEVASECAKKATIPTAKLDPAAVIRSFQSPSSSSSSLSSSAGAKDEQEKPDEVIGSEILRLIMRLETLMVRGTSQHFIPRETLVKFFTSVYNVLPDSTACIVLDYFQEFRSCSPSDPQWERNLQFVLEAFFADRRRSSATRVRALHTIMDAYEIMDLVYEGPHESVPALVKTILADVSEETDVQVLDAVVSLLVSVAVSADMELFNYIVDRLRVVVMGDNLKSPLSPSSAQSPGTPATPERPDLKSSQTSSNVVTRGYVKLFMRLMDTDGEKSSRMFGYLVNVTKSPHCEVDARLTAMKMLFRLRSDWANRVFLTTELETDTMAPSLYRTEASLIKKQAATAAALTTRLSRGEMSGTVTRPSRGISFGQSSAHEKGFPLRSTSNAKPAPNQPYYQLWSFPDPHALPEEVSSSASPILVSYVGEAEDAGEDRPPSQTQLNIGSWLEALLDIFQHGSDWEVYSFVLVHLPSQLSNHSIFRGAIPQVQELRKVLCDQIRLNSFGEPPMPSGLRRADVAICIFHSLTMLLSYHRHFQKQDEDDLVRAFVHGIHTWERSAKTCIHALSICCHELPLSTSKALVQMLQRMSQIITQPHVAMHILEFLSALSRMPRLYVNFREEEYRIVFGIAFRYLQDVRAKRQSNRNSSVANGEAPTVTDDLPQYVYALAYHVITFWFLALKLPDRAAHVGWIAKNLFTDIDGTLGEEQAIITMDFMRRVAYSDADESADDPLFTPERFGEILTRRWVVGNSIITVMQSTTTGWAQVTKRQPSGTSSYMIREMSKPLPPHHVGNNLDSNSSTAREGLSSNAGGGSSVNYVLPSQVLVQLLSPIPQTIETLKPVPLPDNEAVDRAVRLLDKVSTVDGHKVGVIYIGENQTDEVEILANTSGSVDYVEFLNGLGRLTKLKGATFNTQGLDREYGMDGDYTFCWRDRVSEIVFHVTTQMPTNRERDARCTLKKRHIGNDYVNIIFNDSGLPFRFDTFDSEFNFVNIVITPESRATFLARRQRGRDAIPASSASLTSLSSAATATATTGPSPSKPSSPFYRVKVISKPGFPKISPASEIKMVSLNALPGFVRQLAVNASVFSQVWAHREAGEHASTWRERLRQITALRTKYGPKTGPAPLSAPTSSVTSPAAVAANVGTLSAPSPSPPPHTLGGATISAAQGGAGGLHHGSQLGTPSGDMGSRPVSASVRDSFTSFRRSSVATFLTNTSEQTSHRSSMLSTAATADTEVGAHGLEAVVEAVDFSKWA